MEEKWEKISECGGKYEVSNYGNVRNASGKTLKPFLTKGGYLMIALCEEGRKTNFRLHRIVAKAFVPNPEQKPEVNHKNGIKTDNNAANLEWSTKSENMVHAYREGLQRKGKHSVRKVICLNDGKTYATAGEAARKYGLNTNSVTSSCRRLSKRGKLIFRYIEDETEDKDA